MLSESVHLLRDASLPLECEVLHEMSGRGTQSAGGQHFIIKAQDVPGLLGCVPVGKILHCTGIRFQIKPAVPVFLPRGGVSGETPSLAAVAESSVYDHIVRVIPVCPDSVTPLHVTKHRRHPHNVIRHFVLPDPCIHLEARRIVRIQELVDKDRLAPGVCPQHSQNAPGLADGIARADLLAKFLAHGRRVHTGSKLRIARGKCHCMRDADPDALRP